MAYCKRCGKSCADHYMYCKDCYYKLGEPEGAANRSHKCKNCGRMIDDHYKYCYNCAKLKGFIKNF